MEEKDRFNEIKERLKSFLEYQVTNFRFSFPFGRPDGALKATLSLLERVLAKDMATPISRDDIAISLVNVLKMLHILIILVYLIKPKLKVK